MKGDGTSFIKVSFTLKKRSKMANSPTDTVPFMMEQDFGTSVLITDPRSDAILDRASKYGTERYSRWCGGKGGFDDFAERLH